MVGTPRALGRSPKTIEEYRSLIKNGIDPALGTIELAGLSAADIAGSTAFSSRRDWPTTRSTTTTLASLRLCTRRCAGDGYHSPTFRATAPSLRPRDVHPPTLDELRRVLADLEKRTPEFACMVCVNHDRLPAWRALRAPNESPKCQRCARQGRTPIQLLLSMLALFGPAAVMGPGIRAVQHQDS